MQARAVLPLLVLAMTACGTFLPEREVSLPRLPDRSFGPPVRSDVSNAQVRLALGDGVRTERGWARSAPGSATGPDAGKAEESARPTPRGPSRMAVFELLDDRYTLISYDYIPVLLDWYEDLVRTLGAGVHDAGRTEMAAGKVSNLMRIFVAAQLHQAEPAGGAGAPAIGWCRAYLHEDWGPHRRDEAHEFLLIGTERGWFVVDPQTRYMRRLVRPAPYWEIELIVL